MKPKFPLEPGAKYATVVDSIAIAEEAGALAQGVPNALLYPDIESSPEELEPESYAQSVNSFLQENSDQIQQEYTAPEGIKTTFDAQKPNGGEIIELNTFIKNNLEALINKPRI